MKNRRPDSRIKIMLIIRKKIWGRVGMNTYKALLENKGHPYKPNLTQQKMIKQINPVLTPRPYFLIDLIILVIIGFSRVSIMWVCKVVVR